MSKDSAFRIIISFMLSTIIFQCNELYNKHLEITTILCMYKATFHLQQLVYLYSMLNISPYFVPIRFNKTLKSNILLNLAKANTKQAKGGVFFL